MSKRISIAGSEHTYNYVCSVYAVISGRVLLVKHNGLMKWVPPGGHIEPGETFAECAAREFSEETGLRVSIISAGRVIHGADANATPEPLPFYVDIVREGFDTPALVQYYWGEVTSPHANIVPQLEEVDGASWFTASQLSDLSTFDQVRSLAAYALVHSPVSK